MQAKRQQNQVDDDENQHFDGIREEASAPPTPYRVPTVNAVGAALLSGMGFTAAKKLNALQNIHMPAFSTMYDAQKKMLPKIEAVVRESVETAKATIDKNHESAISMDGRWSSRRNGSQCTTSAIDTETNKIVSLAHVIKRG